MTAVRRVLRLVTAGIGLLLYVWFAAVRLLPAVKRRKAARRARRSEASQSS
jgi:hypothetical protein